MNRQAIAICVQCQFYKAIKVKGTVVRRCIQFTKACSTEKLWKGEMSPPKACPNRDQLIDILDV